MRNARLSFSSGDPLEVTWRASMNSLHKKLTRSFFKNLAVAPEINRSVFVSVKRSEDVLGKGLCISPEKG